MAVPEMRFDSNGNLLVAGALGGSSTVTSLTYTRAWSAALTSTWQKVATTTSATKALRFDYPAATTTYDAEWIVATAGAAAPTDTYGVAVLAGEDFPRGAPIGDIYMRSATAQVVIVQTGA